MKILINAISLLGPRTGVGRYTYEVASRIDKSALFEPYYYAGMIRRTLPPNSQNVARLKRYALIKKMARALSRRLPSRQRYDLYWEPNFIPLEQVRASHVVTTLHDFSFHLYPQWHPAERVYHFKKHFWPSLQRSDCFITVSDTIKSEAVSLLKLDPQRVHTIYNGVDHHLFKPQDPIIAQESVTRFHLPPRFVLFVGSVEPRKNLLRLLCAYDRLPERLKKEYPLILAGFSGWNNQQIMTLIKKTKTRYLGYVNEKELSALYTLASVFIYPSLYEGFGLPPLEAMACKTAVIVSNTASMPEICGNGALYCDPLAEESMTEALERLLEDQSLREATAQKGYERSLRFSWERSTQEHIELFKRIGGSIR